MTPATPTNDTASAALPPPLLLPIYAEDNSPPPSNCRNDGDAGGAGSERGQHQWSRYSCPGNP